MSTRVSLVTTSKMQRCLLFVCFMWFVCLLFIVITFLEMKSPLLLLLLLSLLLLLLRPLLPLLLLLVLIIILLLLLLRPLLSLLLLPPQRDCSIWAHKRVGYTDIGWSMNNIRKYSEVRSVVLRPIWLINPLGLWVTLELIYTQQCLTSCYWSQDSCENSMLISMSTIASKGLLKCIWCPAGYVVSQSQTMF